MDPLANFKMEIDAMFDKSFKELSQKNNLNKTILSNLIDAASQQSNKINMLDDKIENLKKVANPDMGLIKNEVKNQEKIIHENFDKMMFRLSQVEEGISHSRKNLQQNLQVNKQSEESMNQLLRQLQKIQRDQRLPQYHGSKDQLYQQIEQFERILQNQTERIKSSEERGQISKKTVIEPLQTFQTKIALHNKNNENILKQKLKLFSNKLKQVQKRVQDAAWLVQNETSKAKQQQSKIVEQMGKIQNEMSQLRNELQSSDKRRKQSIQNSAVKLDQMVEQMLVETKKLEMRVEQLKRGYQNQSQRLRKNIN